VDDKKQITMVFSIHMDYGIMIIVALLGVIIGMILFKSYNVVYRGPNSSKIKNTVYEKDGKCYIFEPSVYICGHKN